MILINRNRLLNWKYKPNYYRGFTWRVVGFTYYGGTTTTVEYIIQNKLMNIHSQFSIEAEASKTFKEIIEEFINIDILT
jgi:hypothetical protein